ncbi:hypothetical protein ES708_31443 [subsurface metagenome]
MVSVRVISPGFFTSEFFKPHAARIGSIAYVILPPVADVWNFRPADGDYDIFLVFVEGLRRHTKAHSFGDKNICGGFDDAIGLGYEIANGVVVSVCLIDENRGPVFEIAKAYVKVNVVQDVGIKWREGLTF